MNEHLSALRVHYMTSLKEETFIVISQQKQRGNTEHPFY